MPIYKRKSSKSSNEKSSSKSSSDAQQNSEVNKSIRKSSKSEKPDEQSKQPLHSGVVKRYLLKNCQFLDDYVKTTVDLDKLRNWLENKERTMGHNAERTTYHPQCPNASLLYHFQQGQAAGRYLEPPCCTCTQLPFGAKTRRPYIIYALDTNDCDCNFHDFTVPRAMTEAEMGAFGRRYGLDLYRRMNMY